MYKQNDDTPGSDPIKENQIVKIYDFERKISAYVYLTNWSKFAAQPLEYILF